MQGHLHARLKFSVVKPLHKKGAVNHMNNYRPITLILILSKIFERIMHDKIYKFLENNKILHLTKLVSEKIVLPPWQVLT